MASSSIESSVATLSGRIEALERDARRMRALFVIALALIFAFGAAAGSVAQQHALSFSGKNGTVTLDGNGLHFKNKRGKDVALIGETALQNTPAIRFYDHAGSARMYLGLDTGENGNLTMWTPGGDKAVTVGGNSTLYLYDSSGKERVFLGTATDENGTLKIWDSAGRERLYAGVTSNHNDGNIQFFDTNGKTQVELASTFLRIKDDSGNEKVYLGDSTDNAPIMRMSDGAGAERVYLGVSTGGDSQLQLFDATHTERNFMGVYTDGSAGFSAYNASGTATWSVP
jgi:hypothetical protein